MRIATCLILFFCLGLKAQDPHFSQYFMAPQLINPAAFGVFNTYEAGLQYKGQWNSFTKGYTSMAAYANKSFKPQSKANSKKAYVSAGINFIYDKAGDGQLTNFKAELPVNVTKRVSRFGFITAGLYAGFGQLSLKNPGFTWGNQFDGYKYDPGRSSNEAGAMQTKLYPDCGVGITYVTFRKEKTVTEMSSPKNMFGLSASHLNKPNYTVYGTGSERLRMRFNYYQYHHLYFKNSDLSLVPSLLVQYQGNAYEVVLGTYVRKMYRTDSRYTGHKKSQYLSLGLFYRLQDMCAMQFMIEMNNYSLGLNYDFNISKLATSSRSLGGLEISLKMNDAFKYLYKGIGKY